MRTRTRSRPGRASSRSVTNRAATPLERARSLKLTNDELFPRNLPNRYRLYKVPKNGGPSEMRIAATAADAQGVGQALITLTNEGELDECAVGILDTMPDGKPSETGRWLVNPFPKVRMPPLPTARQQLSRVGPKRLTEIVELGLKAQELLEEHRIRRSGLNQ